MSSENLSTLREVQVQTAQAPAGLAPLDAGPPPPAPGAIPGAGGEQAGLETLTALHKALRYVEAARQAAETARRLLKVPGLPAHCEQQGGEVLREIGLWQGMLSLRLDQMEEGQAS